jgi:tRNA pseudouridine38-40 synthase
MYAYKCITAYEGTRYNGWQKQGNTDNTIQGKIEEILSKYLEETIEITGSGRTDAGVHALGQVFHFHCEKELEPETFLADINQYLPKDMRILHMAPCSQRFHARLNATGKTYQYRIDISPYGDLFQRNTSHHISTRLDVEAMRQAAGLLCGTHDYKSFCSNKRMKKSSVRTIYTIDIEEKEQMLLLTFTGNGFLYNMVRILTGTLIEVGLGIRPAEEMTNILEGGNRGLAGHTAPAKGLFLVEVQYE